VRGEGRGARGEDTRFPLAPHPSSLATRKACADGPRHTTGRLAGSAEVSGYAELCGRFHHGSRHCTAHPRATTRRKGVHFGRSYAHQACSEAPGRSRGSPVGCVPLLVSGWLAVPVEPMLQVRHERLSRPVWPAKDARSAAFVRSKTRGNATQIAPARALLGALIWHGSC
jgi:hypothetical protein